MSKNCELFINLCTFMKYLLNEILPDQDPNDSVKDAAQDLLSAISKYIRSVEFELSPVFTICKPNKDDFIGHSSVPEEKINFFSDFVLNETRVIGKEKCFQVTHLPLISIPSDAEGISKNLCDEKEMASPKKKPRKPKNEPVNAKYLNEIEEQIILNKGNCNVDGKINKNPNEKNGSPSQKINDNASSNKRTISKKSQTNDGRTKFKNEKDLQLLTIRNRSDKTFIMRTRDVINTKKYQETEMIFEDNFLQFYFFSDLEMHCESSLPSKCSKELKNDSVNYKVKVSDEPSLSTTPEQIKSEILLDGELASKTNSEDCLSIPCGFQAINGCVLSKLVKQAYYCWFCDTSVDTYSELRKHFHDYDRPALNGKDYSFVDVCKDCLFSTVMPASKVNLVLKYHQQTHENASKSLINLYEAYSGIVNLSSEKPNSEKLKLILQDDKSFMDTMLRLKKHRERNSDTSLFLGICCICKAFFFNTLEWSYHLKEFNHCFSYSLGYVTCPPCCLVIFGHISAVKKYLTSSLHLSQHPNSQSGTGKNA